MALGSYRNSPFITGDISSEYGLKTEVLDFEAKKWAQVAEYPYSSGNRYICLKIQENFSSILQNDN